ncbi:hypothetical protein A2U01_0057086, partial [Trifolium medium]|nr:hypothetical protein [Trifolium medium]
MTYRQQFPPAPFFPLYPTREAWQEHVRVDRLDYDATMARNTTTWEEQFGAYEKQMKANEDARAAAPTPLFSMDDFGYQVDDQG